MYKPIYRRAEAPSVITNQVHMKNAVNTHVFAPIRSHLNDPPRYSYFALCQYESTCEKEQSDLREEKADK